MKKSSRKGKKRLQKYIDDIEVREKVEMYVSWKSKEKNIYIFF